tara:strand:- start:1748 stop:2569 length:822 start_codon:yes stop_codon:yes gene_type:complete
MKILITGSSGFLGSSLSTFLYKKGINCISISRRDFKGSKKVENYRHTPDADIIIHLAQCNDRNYVNNQNSDYVKENLEIMKCLVNKNYKKFIYISSASVYGDKNKFPRKTTDITTPYDTYSVIKKSCENIVLQKKGFILRLSNIYGHGMSNKNVMSKIIKKVSNKELITLDNGCSVRDFIWIEDVFEAILKIIELDVDNYIYNIGSGIGVSIKELASCIQLVYRTNLPIIFKNKEEFLSSIVLDISDTKEKLEWEPRVSLEKGISYIMNFNQA